MKSADIIIDTAVSQASANAAALRFAEVKKIDGKRLTVDLAGVDIPNVPFLSSYSPSVGDRAWLLYQGTTLVALGTI